MMIAPFHRSGWRNMSFPEQLITLRKARGLSQKALAEKIRIHVTQVQRYENGTGQPTLDVIRRLALALSVSADALVFDESERGPAGDDLKLLFESRRSFFGGRQDDGQAHLTGLDYSDPGAKLGHSLLMLSC
jgi:transcriptional regulator with XRE-family HTH domain